MTDRSTDDVFSDLDNHTTVQFFNREKYSGVEIFVTRKNWGFGIINLYVNKETGEWGIEDECNSSEQVIEFLQAAMPDIVRKLHNNGEVIP